jgi:hypothetical protein
LRSAAITTGPSTHLDHLAVLAALLSIPLIVDDTKSAALAERFYPETTLIFKEPIQLSLDYLADHYDQLFGCGQFWAIHLAPLFELFLQKKMRFVFCPHGNSEKNSAAEAHILQELSLVYGEQMRSLLMQKNENLPHIVTGNYRLSYYRAHQAFYDACAEAEIFSRLPKHKKKILYAPTWQSRDHLTSFFEASPTLIEKLPPHYSLIIKLHPLLEQSHPAETYHLLETYKGHPDLCFLTDFPPIYPLLAHTDIYLGDYSSMGYDFLAFDRPLYFFNPDHLHLKLHRCGLLLPDNEIYAFIEKTLEKEQRTLSPHRQAAYAHAFATEQAPSLLRELLQINRILD